MIRYVYLYIPVTSLDEKESHNWHQSVRKLCRAQIAKVSTHSEQLSDAKAVPLYFTKAQTNFWPTAITAKDLLPPQRAHTRPVISGGRRQNWQVLADGDQSGRCTFLFGRRDSEAPPCERVTPDVRTSFSVSVFVTPLELAKAGVPNPEQKLVLRRTNGWERD